MTNNNSCELIAQDVISIITNIIEVLEAENGSFGKKIDDYRAIVALKVSLTDMYEQRVKDLTSHPEFPRAISAETFKQLQEVSLKHYEAITYNEKRLNLLIRTTFEILDSVVTQVKKVSGQVKSYGKKGNMLNPTRPVSVTINQNY